MACGITLVKISGLSSMLRSSNSHQLTFWIALAGGNRLQPCQVPQVSASASPRVTCGGILKFWEQLFADFFKMTGWLFIYPAIFFCKKRKEWSLVKAQVAVCRCKKKKKNKSYHFLTSTDNAENWMLPVPMDYRHERPLVVLKAGIFATSAFSL